MKKETDWGCGVAAILVAIIIMLIIFTIKQEGEINELEMNVRANRILCENTYEYNKQLFNYIHQAHIVLEGGSK